MRRSVKATIGVFVAALTTTICVAAPTSAATRAGVTVTGAVPHGPAYFQMTDVTRRLFTVKLTNPKDIAHARALLSGRTSDLPHVMGQIVKRTAPYNPRWSYHIDPRSVTFFDFATEVCDATIPYVEEHLAEAGGAFLPGLRWCDWGSRLVREVRATG